MSGMGSSRKEPGICDNLKSLGNHVIEQKILEHGQAVLKDKGTILDSMKSDLS